MCCLKARATTISITTLKSMRPESRLAMRKTISIRFYGAIRYVAVDSYRCRKLCFPLHVGTKFSSSFQSLSPFSDEGLMDNISNSMLNSKLNPLKGET